MTIQRARSIDELYDAVADYDLVLTTDAPLSLALNRRLDRPHLGRFAATPRMLASGEFRPRDERHLFLELVERTDLGYKHAAYLLEHALQCWRETGDLHAILEYDGFDSPAMRATLAVIGDADSAHRDLATHTIDADVDVGKRQLRNWIDAARDEIAEDLEDDLAAAKWGELGMHDLRRTWATDAYYSLAFAGVPIAEQLVMSWGGWRQTESGRTTFRENYLGPVPDHITERAVEHLSLL